MHLRFNGIKTENPTPHDITQAVMGLRHPNPEALIEERTGLLSLKHSHLGGEICLILHVITWGGHDAVAMAFAYTSGPKDTDTSLWHCADMEHKAVGESLGYTDKSSALQALLYFAVGDPRWATEHKWDRPFPSRDLVYFGPVQSPPPTSEQEEQPPPNLAREGVIYLLKAGPWYKIGKTIDPRERIRQLKIQLPGKTELLHLIATSNIDVLERHWHQHFHDRRGNGEWFQLTEADVLEFVSFRRVEIM